MFWKPYKCINILKICEYIVHQIHLSEFLLLKVFKNVSILIYKVIDYNNVYNSENIIIIYLSNVGNWWSKLGYIHATDFYEAAR